MRSGRTRSPTHTHNPGQLNVSETGRGWLYPNILQQEVLLVMAVELVEIDGLWPPRRRRRRRSAERGQSC